VESLDVFSTHTGSMNQTRPRRFPLSSSGGVGQGEEALFHPCLCTANRRVFALAVALTCILGLFESPGVGLAKERTNLIIGLLLPAQEPQPLSLQQGVMLGVEQANQEGGLPATVVIRGAAGQWGTDAVEAARMVTDDGAEGLIAPRSGASSHLALQVSGRTAVPVISLCPDSSVTQTGVPWMLRITPRTIDEAQTLFLKLAVNGRRNVGARWLALVPSGRPGREIAQDLAQAAASAAVPPPTTIQVKWPLADMPSFCDRVLTNRADAILVCLDPIPAGYFVKSFRAAGFEGPLAGAGWLRCSEFVKAAGPAMGTFVVAAPLLDRSDELRLQRFTSDFRMRFGREPDAMAAMSYDAARLLIHILKRAGDQPARGAFPLTFEHPGATGMLSFDSRGNRQVRLQLVELSAN